MSIPCYKPILLCLGMLLAGGCQTETKLVVAKDGPAEIENVQWADAYLGEAETLLENKENPTNEDIAAKTFVKGARGLLPYKADVDKLNAAKKLTQEIVLGGEAKAQEVLANLEKENAARIKKVEDEKAASEAALGQRVKELEEKNQKLIADQKRLQMEKDAKIEMMVAGYFALTGVVIIGLSVWGLYAGWKRICGLGIVIGILVGGSGVLWNKPWFQYTMGGAIALTLIAFGVYWAVSVYEKEKKDNTQ